MSCSAPDRPTAAWTFGDGLPTTLAAVTSGRGAAHRGVAGALLVEQYAARLVRPVLTRWYRDGRASDCALDRVRVELHEGRVLEVDVAEDLGPVGGAGDVPGRLVTANLEPVVAAVHAATRTGVRVLRGSLAHAVTTTFLALSWPHDDPAHHLAAARDLLERHGLADLVTLEARTVDGRPWLYAERRSCCLAFRSTVRHHDGFCATCPATPPADRHASFVGAVRDFRARRRP